MTPQKALQDRLAALEAQLRAENPNLLPVVGTYRAFDRLLYKTGLLKPEESLATRIPWWPMIAVLGTFSAGKSTFINSYLKAGLQNTGNQAVDDKFTVICFGADTRYEALPGTALNADPRFPFYRIADEVEKVAAGEGKRIDSYLQLKTLSSEQVRGKIIVDSPGFDADDQRRSVLRLVDHIVDLSDLVLVFFDARHPEPGAMHDTLHLLVSKTVRRADARKFLYILNQIDSTAREDNAEAVFGAWQRAVAQAGLVSGRFYGVYDRQAAGEIANPAVRERYEQKCAADMAEIHGRIAEVEIGRGYRIIGAVESIAKEVEGELLPFVQAALFRWRRAVLWADAALIVFVAAVLLGVGHLIGGDGVAALWNGLTGTTPVAGVPAGAAAAVAAVAAALLAGHYRLRASIADRIAARLPERMGEADLNPRNAFLRATRFYRSALAPGPAGWGAGAKRRLFAVRESLAGHVQRLNDMYTDPAGRRGPERGNSEAGGGE